MLRRVFLPAAKPLEKSHCKEALLAKRMLNVGVSFQLRSHIIGMTRPSPHRLRPKILFLKEKIGARGAPVGDVLVVAARALAAAAAAAEGALPIRQREALEAASGSRERAAYKAARGAISYN